MTTTFEFITALFCQVDDQLADLPKHPEAHLWPIGFPEEYAKFLAVALPWIISGIGASHLLMPLTT
jgi:hypothetical protein